MSKRQSLATLRSPSQHSQLGEDRSHRFISHRLVKVRGLAPHHGALQQEVDKGLHPCTPVVYLGKGGVQGAPYSSQPYM
jgi:hypothetical protein